MGFKVGQKVVYPNHGIGTIEQIEQKQIGANSLPFYTLRLAANNSLVLVPIPNASEVGLRAPIFADFHFHARYAVFHPTLKLLREFSLAVSRETTATIDRHLVPACAQQPK